MGKVLAISSRVVRGHVGLEATVPALQSLGHEVWALPTVLLASRPGLGRIERQALCGADLSRMLAALEADGCWPQLDAVFTGYFPSPDCVVAAAQATVAIKAANPAVVVMVDPILGDAGRLYVAGATAETIRDRLMPLATIATPNLFELSWLTGSAPRTLAEIGHAARRLGPATAVVTSASESDTTVATVLVQSRGELVRETAKRPGIPNGPGDLFAGLLLGSLLDGLSPEPALEASLATLDHVLSASVGQDVLQLAALRE